MQELIEYIEMNPIVFNKELLLKLKELTFKEKEQIIDAFNEGIDEMAFDTSGINYYNRNYGE
jgi:hypothetical protein